MTTELIAAINRLAAAQEANAAAQNNIATQIGRIADQITPNAEEMIFPGTGVGFFANAISGAVPDTADALDRIVDAIEEKD